MNFSMYFFLAHFDTLVLFFEYLGLEVEIQKSGTTIDSVFFSLSNETTPTKIGQNLWEESHLCRPLLFDH
jgi:hypothetical protein